MIRSDLPSFATDKATAHKRNASPAPTNAGSDGGATGTVSEARHCQTLGFTTSWLEREWCMKVGGQCFMLVVSVCLISGAEVADGTESIP